MQLPDNVVGVVGAVGNTLYNMYSYPRVTVRMCGAQSALTVMMLVLTILVTSISGPLTPQLTSIACNLHQITFNINTDIFNKM